MSCGIVQLGKWKKVGGISVKRALRASRRAFTLYELMIAMTIFAILAAGVIGATLLARQGSEISVRESIAVSIGVGFLEQLLATDFPNIITHIEDRNRTFPFVSRDGELLDPPVTLRAIGDDAWDLDEVIQVPLVDLRDDNGNVIPGPTMDFWLVAQASRSVDTPNDSVDLEIRIRWNNGRSLFSGNFPERSLAMVRTRIPN